MDTGRESRASLETTEREEPDDDPPLSEVDAADASTSTAAPRGGCETVLCNKPLADAPIRSDKEFEGGVSSSSNLDGGLREIEPLTLSFSLYLTIMPASGRKLFYRNCDEYQTLWYREQEEGYNGGSIEL